MILSLMQDLAKPESDLVLSWDGEGNQDALDALVELAMEKDAASPAQAIKHPNERFRRRKSLPDGVLRTLMGVTVDIIIIFERIHWKIYRENTGSVSTQGVSTVFDEYSKSLERRRIHSEIRNFIEHFNPGDPDDAYTEVVRLIESHRQVESRKSDMVGIFKGSKGKAYKRRLQKLTLV